MPEDDDDFVVAGGRLRLKGCKVEKKKKKKKSKGKSKEARSGDLAKALLTGDTVTWPSRDGQGEHEDNPDVGAPKPPSEDGARRINIENGRNEAYGHVEEHGDEGVVDPDDFKTEAEKRFEEAQRKKVGVIISVDSFSMRKLSYNLPRTIFFFFFFFFFFWVKTTNKIFLTFPSSQLKKLAEKPGARPELLKTHKKRVEELNTYLSKLSEHHDMPKIGPG